MHGVIWQKYTTTILHHLADFSPLRYLQLGSFLCLFGGSLVSYAAQTGNPVSEPVNIDTTEQKMVDAIDAANPRAIALLEELVNINSGSLNLEGVKAVGMRLQTEFEALGFEVSWEDGKAFERAGHLVAYHKGASHSPKLLLIGHLDTVFEPASPFQKFEIVSEGVARGPGISDMKGGDVIMLEAIRALHSVGELDQMDITVVMTGDEELSGRPLSLSKKAIIDAALHADIAIGFENGDGNPKTANVSRRGSLGWTLNVKGKPAHSSQIFRDDIGAGAIFEAARILTQFYEELRSEALLTFNPGKILGGTTVDHTPKTGSGTVFGKNNIIAETAIVTGDLRAISQEQVERVQAKMKAIVAMNLPQTEATITFSEGYPPMAPTEGNQRLLGIYNELSQDLGFGAVDAVDPLRAGAADVSFAAAHVDMAIDALGMSGTEGHTVDELGYLWSVPMQAKRAAVLMYRLQHQLD